MTIVTGKSRWRAIAGLVVVGLALAGPVHAASAIEGVWKTEAGDNAQVYGCGKALCIKLVNGQYAGQVIADDLMADGDVYSGSLRDPADDKVYSGHASLETPTTLKLKGCALKIFCQSQHWSRVK